MVTSTMNPFDQIRNIAQLNEQMRKMFSGDYMQNLVKQIPMSELHPMQSFELENMLGGKTFGAASFEYPRVDLYQTRHEVVAVFEVPGLESAADVRLTVKPETITIAGDIERQVAVEKDRLHLSERFSGSFSRTVTLPARVRPSQTRARCRNGLLEVRMNKEGRPGGRRRGADVPIMFR